ncbi:hypothetical protein ACFSNO_30570 [Streptomyces cirratus]
MLSEQGLIGLTALAGGWGALLVAGLRRYAAGGERGLRDCGLIAVGLLVWQLTDFLYADIGGPSTVLTGVIIGLAAWWALPAGPGGVAAVLPARPVPEGPAGR